MTKKEKNLVASLASIVTRMQHEQREYVYIAHALWSLSDNNLERIRTDIKDLAGMKGMEVIL